MGLIPGQETKISHATGHLTLCATPREAPALQQRPNTAQKKKKKKERRWWQNVDRVGNSDNHRKQSDTGGVSHWGKSQTQLEPTPYLPGRLAAASLTSPSLTLTVCKM